MKKEKIKAIILKNDFKKKDDGYFYTEKNNNIRYKFVQSEDLINGGLTIDYRFEIFKRPYLFGLLGFKRWEFIVQTNGFIEGISFCAYLLMKR